MERAAAPARNPARPGFLCPCPFPRTSASRPEAAPAGNSRQRPRRWWWPCAAILLVLANPASRAGEEPAAELVADSGVAADPHWTSLTYRKKRFGTHLTTTLELSEPPAQAMTAGDLPLPGGPPGGLLSASRLALLTLTARVEDSETALRIWYDARNGTALQRDRLRSGPEASRKVYRFGRKGVSRLRVEPADGEQAQGPAGGWSKRRETVHHYDLAAAGCSSVTTPALLLVLVPRLETGARGISRCVFSSDALYRVWLEPQGTETLAVDYAVTEATGRQRVSGRRRLEKIALRAEPVNTGAGASDFELLELRGDIVLYLDRSYALPVQITGSRAFLSDIKVQLSAATLGY